MISSVKNVSLALDQMNYILNTEERRELKELKNSDLPDEIRIGSILRGNEIIIPSSNYIFKKNDIIILLSKRDQLPTVENMFRISSI